MRAVFTFIILLCSISYASAQHQADNWIFGDHAWLNFDSGAVKSLPGASINTYAGCASISDPATGKLLFYTDGEYVWTANHTKMPNGDILRSGGFSAQSSIIVPAPTDRNRYYIFCTPDRVSGDRITSGFHYSIVDMRLNGGLGDVAVKNVGLLLTRDIADKVTATHDERGTGYWILCHHGSGNAFYAFRLDASGVHTEPVTSIAGKEQTEPSGHYYLGSYMKFSPDGKKIASIYYGGAIEIFDFDKTTGIVSNAYTVAENKAEYGMSFSARNTKLYYGGGTNRNHSVYQFDFRTGTLQSVYTSPDYGNSLRPLGVGALQLAPDGKIYCLLPPDTILVINDPDAPGLLCRPEKRRLPLYGHSYWGLPNMIDSYFNIPCTMPEVALRHTGTCAGEDFYFTEDSVIDAIRWEWSFEGANIATYNDKTPPPLKYSVPGSYKVRLIVDNPCGSDTVNASVPVYPAPVANAGPDLNTCLGSSVRIGSAPEKGLSYEWSPADGLDDPRSANPVISPKVSGRYFLKVANEQGCTSYDTVDITVGRLIVKGNNAAICRGDSVLINVTDVAGAKYMWSPSTGLSDNRIARPLAKPLKTTVYRVFVEAGGCADSTLVTITVNDPPVADAGSPKSVCRGESAEIGGPEDAKYSYLWTPVTGLSDPRSSATNAAPERTTEYILGVTDRSNGCTAYDTVLVSVSDKIELKAEGGAEICSGDEITLSAESNATSFTWMDKQGKVIADRKQFVFAPATSGWYKVRAENGSCSAEDSVYVLIHPRPVFRTQDTSICEGESVELSAETNADIIAWRWSPEEGLSDANTKHPLANPTQTTEYTVTATNALGCSGSAMLTVNVEPRKVYRFALEAAGKAHPGEETKILLTVNPEEKISSLKGEIRFDKDLLSLSEKTPSVNTFGWSMRVRENVPGVIEFEGSGEDFRFGEIIFPMLVYLSEVKNTTLWLEIEEPAEEACVLVGKVHSTFEAGAVCADLTRTIKAGTENFLLGEIYPHPVTNEAKISYSLGFRCHTRIALTSAMGEEVSVLIDHEENAGNHEISLPAGIASGVYFIRMSAGDFMQTKAILVEK